MSGIQSVVRDKAGNAIASATVTVFITGTTTAASIFSDPELTQPQVNPFVADSSGFYSFYAVTAVYDIQFEKAGFPTVLLTEVELALGAFGGTINGNVIINGNLTVTGTITGSIDHSTLLNLASDDHLQYLNRSGVRPMTGDLDMGENNITDLTEITGPDTGGALRPGILMTEGADPELKLVWNEALLPGTPDILLDSDGINFGPPVRGIGPAKIVFEDELQMQSNLITGVLDPVGPQDAATKEYVDTVPSEFIVGLSGDQQFTTGAVAAPAWDTFLLNNGGHSFSGNDVNLGTAGLYLFTCQLQWEFDAVGQREGFITRTDVLTQLGASGVAAMARAAAETYNNFASILFQAAVGNDIGGSAVQTSGGNLDLLAANSWLHGIRLRP